MTTMTAGTFDVKLAPLPTHETDATALLGRMSIDKRYHGAPQLTLKVVPDSATGQLEGLTGSMAIRIENDAHFYEFTHTLAEAP